ncbi:MAG: hypothetical protein AUK47_02875 [Deltaproteobacteria bacterium CG2_30_63_29]|nr:MAG: hypothetical protein AUK47_02875 [Deltaproteobacteria bacterium CG2_30_63_29]
MTSTRSQSVSVIGAGAWGNKLIANLSDLRALHAIVDSDATHREQLARQYPQVQLFESHKALLSSGPGPVVIATPSASHFAIAKDCLVAGCDVFVEKPMTLDSASAAQLVELARRHERVLMVGHLLLYQPAIRWLKVYLESGVVGKVLRLEHQRLGFGRAKSHENALWSLGVHDVAVALYLAGEQPRVVSAAGHKSSLSVADDVRVHLSFPSGLAAHVHASWLWPERVRKLTVVAERGMLVYDEIAQTVTLHRQWLSGDLTHHDDGASLLYEGDPQPLRLELAHFLDCVASRRTPLTDGESAVEVLRVLEAADGLLF